jgi:hypothetical protein
VSPEPGAVRSSTFSRFLFISAVLLSGRGLYGSPPRACRYCFLMGQRTSGFGSEKRWNGVSPPMELTGAASLRRSMASMYPVVPRERRRRMPVRVSCVGHGGPRPPQVLQGGATESDVVRDHYQAPGYGPRRWGRTQGENPLGDPSPSHLTYRCVCFRISD